MDVYNAGLPYCLVHFLPTARVRQGARAGQAGPHLCCGAEGGWGGPGPGAAARPAPRAPPRRRGPPAAARCAALGAASREPGRVAAAAGPPGPGDAAGCMEPPEGASPGEIVKEVEVPRAALDTPTPGTGDSCHSPVAEEEEEVGIPIPAPGFLQVTERRQPLSSVSSLEVHFDLLDLTELTDMSDQELAEVFADSDDENLAENLAVDSPAGLHPLPRAGCLRSPSWARSRAEQNREKQPLSDTERQTATVDTFLTVERPQD
ncbi:dysbindin domain-containing protein 1 [Artibeus jamaicensis]|uniref:dysbindin domain-containing protein 1 n=1 Tax=Artibeus jamaicensis TaxID=9417 RepID=UPI00235AB709|nr:dysbindin domain-containing protein 1 [Artibeus jamaicensis]